MSDATRPSGSHPGAPTEQEIREWLRVRISHLAELDVSKVDASKPLEAYGIDSLQAGQLTEELQRWLGRELSPTLAWDYPTIDVLANHLATT